MTPKPVAKLKVCETVTLSDLIARLEKCTGPDRELDCRIGCLIRGWSIIEDEGQAARWKDGNGAAWIGEPNKSLCTNFSSCAHYTSSIDAALTLLGGMYCIYAMEDPGVKYLPANPDGSYIGAREIVVSHPHIPIALCIAALKARKP